MGALWPGGPWEPPIPIALGSTTHQWDQMAPLVAISHIAKAQFFDLVVRGISARDQQVIQARIKSPQDGLDRHHIERAGVYLAIGLVGIADGLKGFRAAMRICGTVMAGWPAIGGMLAANNVDVSKSAVWQTSATLYHLLVENPESSKDDRIKHRQQFYQALPGEPEHIFADAGKQVRAVTQHESASSWQKFRREYEASRPRK